MRCRAIQAGSSRKYGQDFRALSLVDWLDDLNGLGPTGVRGVIARP